MSDIIFMLPIYQVILEVLSGTYLRAGRQFWAIRSIMGVGYHMHVDNVIFDWIGALNRNSEQCQNCIRGPKRTDQTQNSLLFSVSRYNMWIMRR